MNDNTAWDELKKLVELDKAGQLHNNFKKCNMDFRIRSGLTRSEFDKRKQAGKYSYK